MPNCTLCEDKTSSLAKLSLSYEMKELQKFYAKAVFEYGNIKTIKCTLFRRKTK